MKKNTAIPECQYIRATRVFFGVNTLSHFESELQRLKSQRVLLVYGRSSAKGTGVFNEVVNVLHRNFID